MYMDMGLHMQTREKIVGFSEDSKLKVKDLLIDIVTFDFGMKEKDPFDSIRFFSKKDHNKAKKIPLKEISTLLPKKFQEEVIRVYCVCSSKLDEEKEKVKEAERYAIILVKTSYQCLNKVLHIQVF